MKRTDIIIGGHYLRNGQPVRVDDILGSKVKCGMYIIPINMLEPMPLTPKILEKNGFVDAGFFGRLELNGFVIICDTQNLTILRDGHCDLEIPVRSVHELQQALRTCTVDLDIVL